MANSDLESALNTEEEGGCARNQKSRTGNGDEFNGCKPWGATSLFGAAGRRRGALRDEPVALPAQRPARLAAMALADKLARIVFAMMATGEAFPIEILARDEEPAMARSTH
jgi:hypothetical protein